MKNTQTAVFLWLWQRQREPSVEQVTGFVVTVIRFGATPYCVRPAS